MRIQEAFVPAHLFVGQELGSHRFCVGQSLQERDRDIKNVEVIVVSYLRYGFTQTLSVINQSLVGDYSYQNHVIRRQEGLGIASVCGFVSGPPVALQESGE